MTVEARLTSLEQEFTKCQTEVGQKMLTMERDSIEKLTRLEVLTGTMSAQLQTYVTQHQFAPVKLISYGLAGGVLTTVLGAIMAKVLGL